MRRYTDSGKHNSMKRPTNDIGISQIYKYILQDTTHTIALQPNHANG